MGVALIDPCPEGQGTAGELAAIARALAAGGATVAIAPWYRVRTEGHPCAIVGACRFVDASGAEETRDAGGLAPSAVLVFPTAGARRVGRSNEEQQGLASLRHRRPGLQACAMDVAVAVADEAAARGLPSNAPGSDQDWGRKDTLEYSLRAYRRLAGVEVPRPRTFIARGSVASKAIAELSRRGRLAISKPVDGARGEGIRISAVDEEGRPHVVQALGNAPVLWRGRKLDLRCYVVLDTARRDRSGWIGPAFARIAGAAYQPGLEAAEITNCAYRSRADLELGMPEVRALGMSGDDVGELERAAGATLRALVDARWFRARTFDGPAPPRRVLLWGVDLLPQRRADGVVAELLEVNVFPHLFMGSPTCDARIAEMLAAELAPLLTSMAAAS